jgi:IS5 family transposase
MEDSPMKTLLLAIVKAKASIRAKVEHSFHAIKNLFDYRKVRYKGLAKEPASVIQPVRAGQLDVGGTMRRPS